MPRSARVPSYRRHKASGRIKRAFKWAVGNEPTPPATHQALATVEGLRRGRTEARESALIRPVSDDQVGRTLPHLRPAVANMVRLQRLASMRPGEACRMRRDAEET